MIQRYGEFWFFRNESGNSFSSPYFVYDFLRKIFPMLYFINWPNFIVWLHVFLEILGNMCTAIVCFPGFDVMNAEFNLIFLIKSFFLHVQKVTTKFLMSWERKELIWWNKKHFSSILKGFQLLKTYQTWECVFNYTLKFRFEHKFEPLLNLFQ